ncbi:3-ketoacyl-ACP reductase [Propionivibrio dicarboxylicus]|uniref:NAD(P)-dependent dehydrogenase, short-chain alcohol dehydrogenase family n=2 Tax=Propionivibrio dicarboxylicus TaxID=83767 RepID=A0A1G8J509_9RHOO|nr:3-ketoacyl-ACP reductase [Propionivibrio dicarboxylicus]SDI26355.1 NAD(P)-dependent dehydrogenase, short-chain alcohol dehydrogenase family [Propionivibrio dicarboxylicus]
MSENKLAIVTGASRGIGNAIATRLATEGYAIVAVGTSAPESIAPNFAGIEQAGNPWVYVQADVSTPAGREKIVSTAMARFGRIDVLVNNAGVAPKVRMDLLETSEESLDRLLDINLKSTFFLSQSVARIMESAKAEDPQRTPKIINISSVSAYTSSTMRGEYCISKAAISMVTLLFADRLAAAGINVYEIRPGIIATDMTSVVKDKYDAMIANGLTPIKRWGQPEDVAKAVWAACSGLLDFCTGEVINVDGGFHIRRL